ncbi:asparaginase [Coprinopsis sp. MPI-PUGE-AT-0042]|nr:asparaginase [Coprinopsis sp. MPI-PUGE-AT-0042]
MGRLEKSSYASSSTSDDSIIPINAASNYVLVIHGGAGTMSKEGSTPEQRLAYKTALGEALRSGSAILKEGGEAMDAAVAAVVSLEDNPLFNAGKGAVFNTAGKNELEASIALSKPPASHPNIPSNRLCTSLTLLTRVRNPSKLARAVYLAAPREGDQIRSTVSEDYVPESSSNQVPPATTNIVDDNTPPSIPHPFLSGPYADSDTLANQLGIELVDPSYFFTERRWREHRQGLGLPAEPRPGRPHLTSQSADPSNSDLPPQGTVGAIALDIRGCVVAVTSTGGKTNKLPGRIGDTPVMGCGFWAGEWDDDQSSGQSGAGGAGGRKRAVGISGTGDGDFFIRQCTAHLIASRMQLLGESVQDASSRVVKELGEMGGMGGVIALDMEGNVAMPLNSTGMYRGFIRPDGIPKVAIFSDEELEEAPRSKEV